MTDFAKTRQMFDIPKGMIYLNGNSLGPMPKAAPAAMKSFLLDEWRTELIRGWNTKNWFMQTNTLGDRVGRLIGAAVGTTVVGDTLSIKVFQAVAAGSRRGRLREAARMAHTGGGRIGFGQAQP